MKSFLAVMCFLAQAGGELDAGEGSAESRVELHAGVSLEASALALLPRGAPSGKQ
jgi:hypothetical protein